MQNISADLTNQPIVWRPGQEQLERSRALAFARRHGLESWEDLCARAAEDPAWFWSAVDADLGLVWTTPYREVLDVSNGPEWPEWFVDGRMNYVTSAVERWLPERADQDALRWEGEDGTVRNLTFAELAAAVNRCANALSDLGVVAGDRVGIFMPMLPETAIATLACGKLGALFVPIFSGYGPEAVATRLNDAGATVLISANGFHRRGRIVGMKGVADAALELAPTVKKHVVVRHTAEWVSFTAGRDVWWDEIVDAASPERAPADTAANDPYMLIYTSGTTGKPKGAVHVHAGFPVKAAQDMAFCFDIQPGDVLLWLTDIGWMMGPWAIAGGLIAGATVVLFEGTPDYPEPDRLWQLVEDHGVTVLGISPTAIRALMPRGDEWVEKHPMPTLRALGSTGEPWNPGPWRWTFDVVGRGRCPIVNYSGGTEISGGIISAPTVLPQKPCAFSGPVPGVPADVVDDVGNTVHRAVGELVIRGPWVGMTRGFWGADQERYIDSYWSRMPGMWVHGDFALVDEDGFWYILGRSDDTLKIAGKRVGPAEIESAAVEHEAVQEAAAIGIPHEIKGESIVVFVILKPGESASDTLRAEIRDTVARQLGRPLQPDRVLFVKNLPKTRNAKIMRRIIRATYLQQQLGDLTALEDPAAVDEIRNAR